MTAIDDLLDHNRDYADSREPDDLPPQPALKVAIVTCMDCRLDVDAAFGVSPGQAHIMRNAGGVVTDDVIRSLAISQRKLGTREIAVVHHTQCGMETVTDDGLRAELLEDVGMTPPWAVEAFGDAADDVRQCIRRIKASPFIPYREDVRGFIYDVATHRLEEVPEAG